MQTIIQKYKEKFYGRIKSRSLTENQTRLFDELLPDISIKDPTLFTVSSLGYDNVFIEIGFGGGEHIAAQAMNNPNNLYIGCEPFINGVASLLVKIDENAIKNILIFPDDARKLLCEIPECSIDGVFLLFPDPWPKRRHFDRRFVNNSNMSIIHKILKEKGTWKIATDHKDYASWILKKFEQHSDLFEINKKYSKLNRPSLNAWPQTRYELKSDSDSMLYVIYEKK